MSDLYKNMYKLEKEENEILRNKVSTLLKEVNILKSNLIDKDFELKMAEGTNELTGIALEDLTSRIVSYTAELKIDIKI